MRGASWGLGWVRVQDGMCVQWSAVLWAPREVVGESGWVGGGIMDIGRRGKTLAPDVGLEPTTTRLRALRSTD